MEDNTLYLIVGSVLTIGILYLIIHYASGAKERKKQLQLQNAILIHIAKKLEVDKDALQKLQDLNNK